MKPSTQVWLRENLRRLIGDRADSLTVVFDPANRKVMDRVRVLTGSKTDTQALGRALGMCDELFREMAAGATVEVHRPDGTVWVADSTWGGKVTTEGENDNGQ